MKRLLGSRLALTLALLLCFASLASAAVYTYDELGRLISVTYDNGQTINYGYDAAGNVSTSPQNNSYVISDDFSQDSGLWTYSGSAYRDTANSCLVITPNAANKTGVVWLKNDIFSPFTAEFKYKAGGGTGAEGLTFMFYKNKNYTPSGGNYLGFCNGQKVTGYGIEFDTYKNSTSIDPNDRHVALIKDITNDHFLTANDTRVRDNNWHDIKVVVDYVSTAVYMDNQKILDYKGTIDPQYGGFGFSASTGGSYDWHLIDDLRVEVPATPAEPPQVVSIDPGDGAVEVPVGDKIKVNFNEDVLKSSAFGNISLMNGTVPVDFRLAVSGSNLTLTPVANLVYGSSYTVTVPAHAVRDLTNNDLPNDYTFSFTAERDVTPPSVTNTDVIGQALEVNFTENIFAGNAMSGITLNCGQQVVDFTYQINGSKLHIVPVSTLVYGADYTLTLPANAVKDWVDNGLTAQYRYDFVARPSWDRTDTSQSDWQQGTLQNVIATANGEIELQKKEDQFTDIVLNPMWTWETPKTGPTYSLTERPGWFRLKTPQGAFDYTTTLDNAPKLKTGVASGDWTQETKYDLSTLTDNSNFQVGLMVYFSKYDSYYWGPKTTTNLALDRTSTQNILSTWYSDKTGYLRVRKVGNTYYFDYKAAEKDDWINAGSQTTVTVPQAAGVIMRKWNYNYPPTNVDFDYFKLTYTSGSRTSPVIDLSPGGISDGSRVLWTANLPFNTGVNVETNLSLDGGSTWQGWRSVNNRATLPDLNNGTDLTNVRLMYRTNLSGTDIATPQLQDMTVTVYPKDLTSPVLTQTNPTNGETDVQVDKAVYMQFDEAVFAGPNFNGIAIKDNRDNTVVTLASISQADILKIIPETQLEFNVTYTVYLPAGSLQDKAGNSVTASSCNFTTLLPSDTTPPEAVSSDPANDATGVPIGTIITVTFSENIQEGPNVGAVTLQTGNTQAGYSYSITDNILRLTPSYNLANNTSYVVNIPADAITDTAGNSLSNPFSLAFTTVP